MRNKIPTTYWAVASGFIIGVITKSLSLNWYFEVPLFIIILGLTGFVWDTYFKFVLREKHE